MKLFIKRMFLIVFTFFIINNLVLADEPTVKLEKTLVDGVKIERTETVGDYSFLYSSTGEVYYRANTADADDGFISGVSSGDCVELVLDDNEEIEDILLYGTTVFIKSNIGNMYEIKGIGNIVKATDIKDIVYDNEGNGYLISNEGYLILNRANSTVLKTDDGTPIIGVRKIVNGKYTTGTQTMTSHSQRWYITDDKTYFAGKANTNNRSGTGLEVATEYTEQDSFTAEVKNVTDVKDVYKLQNEVYFLTNSGELYACGIGILGSSYSEPTKIQSDVIKLVTYNVASGSNGGYFKRKLIITNDNTYICGYSQHDLFSDDELTSLNIKGSDIKEVKVAEYQFYIITKDGKIILISDLTKPSTFNSDGSVATWGDTQLRQVVANGVDDYKWVGDLLIYRIDNTLYYLGGRIVKQTYSPKKYIFDSFYNESFATVALDYKILPYNTIRVGRYTHIGGIYLDVQEESNVYCYYFDMTTNKSNKDIVTKSVLYSSIGNVDKSFGEGVYLDKKGFLYWLNEKRKINGDYIIKDGVGEYYVDYAGALYEIGIYYDRNDGDYSNGGAYYYFLRKISAKPYPRKDRVIIDNLDESATVRYAFSTSDTYEGIKQDEWEYFDKENGYILLNPKSNGLYYIHIEITQDATQYKYVFGPYTVSLQGSGSTSSDSYAYISGDMRIPDGMAPTFNIVFTPPSDIFLDNELNVDPNRLFMDIINKGLLSLKVYDSSGNDISSNIGYVYVSEIYKNGVHVSDATNNYLFTKRDAGALADNMYILRLTVGGDSLFTGVSKSYRVEFNGIGGYDSVTMQNFIPINTHKFALNIHVTELPNLT